MVTVQEDLRGQQGHANWLMDMFLGDVGESAVYLEVDSKGGLTNERLQQWYQSKGFHAVGTSSTGLTVMGTNIPAPAELDSESEENNAKILSEYKPDPSKVRHDIDWSGDW